MDMMMIDTAGDPDLLDQDQLQKDDDDKDVELDPRFYSIFMDPPVLGSDEKKKPKKKTIVSTTDFDLEQFEADMGWKTFSRRKSYKPLAELAKLRKDITPLNKILEKSVIKPDFERLHTVPPYDLSKRQLEIRRERQKRKMGAGAGWYNMRTSNITPEIQHDLDVLRMRSALDPKHFYKKNDMQALPKHFHVGKVMDSPMDFYCSRLTKKERKKTIVDELMQDAEFTKYNKRKYKEIIEEKKKMHYKAHRHAKRLKGKKK